MLSWSPPTNMRNSYISFQDPPIFVVHFGQFVFSLQPSRRKLSPPRRKHSFFILSLQAFSSHLYRTGLVLDSHLLFYIGLWIHLESFSLCIAQNHFSSVLQMCFWATKHKMLVLAPLMWFCENLFCQIRKEKIIPALAISFNSWSCNSLVMEPACLLLWLRHFLLCSCSFEDPAELSLTAGQTAILQRKTNGNISHRWSGV